MQLLAACTPPVGCRTTSSCGCTSPDVGATGRPTRTTSTTAPTSCRTTTTSFACSWESNSNGTGVVHGVYENGTNNNYRGCWWERNGIDDPTYASAGLYITNVGRGGDVGARITDCHFASHWTQIHLACGTNCVIDRCMFDWNPAVNDPAHVNGAIRIESAASPTTLGMNRYQGYESNGKPRIYATEAVRQALRLYGDSLYAPGGVRVNVSDGPPSDSTFSTYGARLRSTTGRWRSTRPTI